MKVFTNISRSITTAFAGLALLAMPALMQAQPNVDITLVDNGNNELEVRVRPDAGFDGIFSSLVFTLRWNANDGADLGAISQVVPTIAYMPISKSGDQTDDNGDRYQVFAGFGFSPLSTFGVNWDPNTEYTLMTIPVVNGASAFELVNDNWTDANNGDYYISLGGQDRTGIIYFTNTVSVEMGPDQTYNVEVLPNPNQGDFTMVFTTSELNDHSIELVNSLGQVLYQENLKQFTGTYRHQFNLKDEGAGVYFLRINGEKDGAVHRVVVK